jgi:hypothetical protein
VDRSTRSAILLNRGLISLTGDVGAYFGHSLAMVGSLCGQPTLAVGARYESRFGANRGAVFLLGMDNSVLQLQPGFDTFDSCSATTSPSVAPGSTGVSTDPLGTTTSVLTTSVGTTGVTPSTSGTTGVSSPTTTRRALAAESSGSESAGDGQVLFIILIVAGCLALVACAAVAAFVVRRRKSSAHFGNSNLELQANQDYSPLEGGSPTGVFPPSPIDARFLINWDELSLGKELASGTFGVVYR